MTRLRRLLMPLLFLLALVVPMSVSAGTAHAAESTHDRFDVAYKVNSDGTVDVAETIVLRFGPTSGRHGYERQLITREKFSDDQDRVYEYSNVDVSSPSGVSTRLSTYTNNSGRNSVMTLRIGDPNRTISAATATYVIKYRVTGALMTANGVPEFSWDVTGSSMGAIKASRVTVEAPGGVTAVQCSAALPGQRGECTSATVESGKGVFVQNGIPEGSLLTIGNQMTAGAVQNATPILVEPADAAETRSRNLGLGVGGVAALAIPFLGWAYYRRNGRDDRFVGAPPGTFPPAGAQIATAPSAKIEVPVAFSPPKLPLTHAGFLLDGQVQTSHLTAAMVNMAVKGAIRLHSEPDPAAEAVDSARVPDGPSVLLWNDVFAEGSPAVLNQPGTLHRAQQELAEDAERTAVQQGWFKRLSVGRGVGSVAGIMILGIFGFQFLASVTSALLWIIVPVALSLIITMAVVRHLLRRGSRTAVGRAWTDQIEGFRTYIATAEADQLKFEEGEDVFSKYLPWAILFGLADRWVKVCQRAIDLGLMSEPDPYWYGGYGWDPTFMLWNLSMWDNSMQTASVGAPSMEGFSFGSDSGFGGGSMFDDGGGGGFSGLGGGGGGGDSW